MDESMKEELLTRLDALAEKLGTTGEYLWEVLVRQAEIQVYQDLLTSAVLFICGGVLLALGLYLLKQSTSYVWGGNEDSYTTMSGRANRKTGAFFSWAGSLFFLILSLSHAASLLTPLLNPEYWALKQVLEVLR